MAKFNLKHAQEPPEGEQMQEVGGNIYGEQIAENAEKIGAREVQEAIATLNKYKQGKANLEKRIIANEQWWKLQQWGEFPGENKESERDRIKPTSAWLFNSLINKHADAMDNFPEPNVLPREENDKDSAEQLSSILPVVLEHNNYESTYSDGWWYKLKAGTKVEGVFWNTRKENGLGDIDIKQIDILNLFWEPGIKNVQDSRNLFYVSLVDNDVLCQQYPEMNKNAGGTGIEVAKYRYDENIDTTEKSVVVDWYYKIYDGDRQYLHYCKFCNGIVLYASENDPQMAQGFYAHGKYPFIFDTLFVTEGSPCGFGYVDIMKSPQMYIDKLNQVILEHTVKMSRKRFFVKNGAPISEDEFLDWTKPFVHVNGSLGEDNIREINVNPLETNIINALTNKIDEIKETSGNRDFSQGSTVSGVTAASAIAALQEAGSKTSRDSLKASYNAYTELCYFVIELIRQFYDEPRCFRIRGKGGDDEFQSFDNRDIKPQAVSTGFGLEQCERKPVFDIIVSAQKKSPFNRVAQNELAKELYGMGFFEPSRSDQVLAALDMMDFEGKDGVAKKIAENGTMLQTIQTLQQQMLQMATIIDKLQGTQIAQSMAAEMQGQSGQGEQNAPQSAGGNGNMQINSLGNAVQSASGNASTNKAKAKAQAVASPR